MISKPLQVKALEKYKIWIKFADKTEGNIDLSHLAGKGVFIVWDNNENFKNVFIDPETNCIAWSKDVELDATNLYLKIIGKSFEQWKSEQLEYASNK